jgi:hypothetical protein
MTNSSTKIHTQLFRMKKLLGAVMLASLAIGQPVFAHPIPDAALATLMPYKPGIVTTVDSVPAETIAPTVQDVLLNVCEQRGYGEDCAKTLLGMLWTESSNRSTVIGDNGSARGYFQIHYKLHKISTACAEDLVCSANWSLTYLESHNYPKYTMYAVQCHNSCGVNNGYAAKVARNSKLMWDQPLVIDQLAPITLAMN